MDHHQAASGWHRNNTPCFGSRRAELPSAMRLRGQGLNPPRRPLAPAPRDPQAPLAPAPQAGGGGGRRGAAGGRAPRTGSCFKPGFAALSCFNLL